ncbi:MAG: type II secretion system protein [Candidatus Paceibacterota bacterium]
MKLRCELGSRAFTLIELLVSISIFVFMTALLLAKYGNFNQSVLMTNLAYDMVLTLRTAQTYGLSVQGDTSGSSPTFGQAYGVAFCKNTSCNGTSNNQNMIMFADNNKNGVYNTGTPPDSIVANYSIKRGAKVLGFCDKQDGSGCISTGGTNSSISSVDISFLRPDPNAIICTTKNSSVDCNNNYIKVILQSSDASNIRSIVVRSTGQMSVEE